MEGEWPGELRRNPPRSSPTFLLRAPLSRWLQDEARTAAERYGHPRVLDVGCGVKPYYPFFAAASEYVGLDVVENPAADVHGSVEAMPLPDASFDVVLCNQVLEHTVDPQQAVRELRRVTAPGGRVLASTHGVEVYHPSPEDNWRWTHTGLERLFTANGDWETVAVEPNAGTTSALAMLVARSLHLLAKRAGVGFAARPFVYALNAGAAAIDAHVP